MAKSPITKTANIVLPIAGIGILIGIGFLVYTKFFRSQTDEQQAEEQARQEKGAIKNTLDFLFGEPTQQEVSQAEIRTEAIPNEQITNTTPNLDGGSNFFEDFFGGINRFFFPTQEGQSNPTTETAASDSGKGTTDPSGAKTSSNPGTRAADENIPSTQGGARKQTTPQGFQQLPSGQTLRELQRNKQTFGQKPKRGGRITSGGSSKQKNPGNTTSNADSSTQRKSQQSRKDITVSQTKPKTLLEFVARSKGKTVGTSRTSSRSSGSPTSSTSTTEKPKQQLPTTTGRRSGNTRTTNSGTGTTNKTQTRQTQQDRLDRLKRRRRGRR